MITRQMISRTVRQSSLPTKLMNSTVYLGPAKDQTYRAVAKANTEADKVGSNLKLLKFVLLEVVLESAKSGSNKKHLPT